MIDSRPWITHSSTQRIDVYRTAENVTEWREQWGKPVVVDECAYEGDLDQGWGNITGEEMTRRFWEGAVRGGYVGHGETHFREDHEIWRSKGGDLHGTSPDRIAFLAWILAEAPGGFSSRCPRSGTPRRRASPASTSCSTSASTGRASAPCGFRRGAATRSTSSTPGA